MRDRGIRENSFYVVLQQRKQIADQHGCARDDGKAQDYVFVLPRFRQNEES